jgi:hypothetical protein
MGTGSFQGVQRLRRAVTLITPSRAEVEELKNTAILLLLCVVMARYMVNLPYLTLREEYNYGVRDENRVSGIKWGSNNEVQPAYEKLEHRNQTGYDM